MEKISLKIKTELKFKLIYIYRGRKTDLISRRVKTVKVKDKNTTPNKLKKKIRG